MEQDIQKFLEGFDDEKYITALEYDYKTSSIIKIKDDPIRGKLLVSDKLTPFCFIGNLSNLNFYGGSKEEQKKAISKHGIVIEKLNTGNNTSLQNGLKYVVKTTKTLNNLINFFKDGGIDPWKTDEAIMLPIKEQYLIQKQKRLFKGYEDYESIHKLCFDLETTSLDPTKGTIFLIGLKDSKGYEKLIECNNEEKERNGIIEFFNTIDKLKPSIIMAYNSSTFDWPFLLKRAEILGIDYSEVIKTLDPDTTIKINDKAVLKLGNKSEYFNQIKLWGYNVVDVAHAVRRAKAINSDIKAWNLKYITKYIGASKKNRVYIKGDNISKIYFSDEMYYFNDNDGRYTTKKPEQNIIFKEYITREDIKNNPNTWYIFGDNMQRSGHGGQAKEMRGEPNTIGIRTKKKPSMDDDSFFTDDEFESNCKLITEDIDAIKLKVLEGRIIIFPKAGIGTGLSGLKHKAPKTFDCLIAQLKELKQYSDNFKLVDGKYIVKRYLMDDLDETFEVDREFNQAAYLLAKNIPTDYERVSTMGTASLWKMLMLSWSYENNLAIPKKQSKREFTGGLSRLVSVGFNKNIVKFDFSSLYPSIQLVNDVFPDSDITGVMKRMLKYFRDTRIFYKNETARVKKSDPVLSKSYDRKQLPLKIFINSMFGALSAPHVFPWGDIDKGEMITCTGRQYLRKMIKFFMDRGFKPLVLDTDGVNFTIPDDIESCTYIGQGLNELTEKDKEYKGIKAVVAEFNDVYLRNEMGLSIDGQWPSSINLARKNYALLNYNGKVKLTGNTIKSDRLPGYIEEFFDKGLKMLLNGNGSDFIEYYYETISKLFNKEIPLLKLANKSKVNISLKDYINRLNKKNKAGNDMSRMAHMELLIKDGIEPDLGDVVYYVNNGKVASHGDVQKKGDGIVLNCYKIDVREFEVNPNMLGDYNVPKYISAFNKSIKPLLIVFKEEIRNSLIIKDPKNRQYYTKDQTELISGIPTSEDGQDDLEEDVFKMEDKENIFWNKVGVDPNYMFSTNDTLTTI